MTLDLVFKDLYQTILNFKQDVRKHIIYNYWESNLFIVFGDQLYEVLAMLKFFQFSSKKWYLLGAGLGIPKADLDVIKEDKCDCHLCLMECLSVWLKNVTCSWKNLVKALCDTHVGERAIADGILKLGIYNDNWFLNFVLFLSK